MAVLALIVGAISFAIQLYPVASASIVIGTIGSAIVIARIARRRQWLPRRTDLVVTLANFVVTWIVAFWGLRVPALQMPAAFAFSMGLILAACMALGWRYLWQYRIFREGKLTGHLAFGCALSVLIIASFAFGLRVGDGNITRLLAPGHLELGDLWMAPSWIAALVVSCAANYLELWTVFRRVVDPRK